MEISSVWFYVNFDHQNILLGKSKSDRLGFQFFWQKSFLTIPERSKHYIWLCQNQHNCVLENQLIKIHGSWQESHGIEHKPCELLVLFSSCGILATGSRTDNWPWPRQTLPEPHDFTMTSFTSTMFHSPNDGSHLQLNRATSSLKGPHHPQEFVKRSPVGFLLKATGKCLRSGLQDELLAQISSTLVWACFTLTILSFHHSNSLSTNS